MDMAGLAAMERHGKREDQSSQLRRVRDADPLIFKSLDLRRSFDAHIDGVRQNKSAKRPVLHFIVRFPPDLLEGPDLGLFAGSKNDRQKQMILQAVEFIEGSHGGDAVFAARLDRDEEGQSIVDVFAAPKYEKRTKRTPPDRRGEMWASATKFGKDLAVKHQEEIRRRHPNAKGRLSGPRHVGIALQSEFAEFFYEKNGVSLAPKFEKTDPRADRLEKEAHDRLEQREARTKEAELQLKAREAHALKLMNKAREQELHNQEVALKLEVKERRLISILNRVKNVVALTFGALKRPLPSRLVDAIEDLETEVDRLSEPVEELGEDPSPGF